MYVKLTDKSRRRIEKEISLEKKIMNKTMRERETDREIKEIEGVTVHMSRREREREKK